MSQTTITRSQNGAPALSLQTHYIYTIVESAAWTGVSYRMDYVISWCNHDDVTATSSSTRPGKYLSHFLDGVVATSAAT